MLKKALVALVLLAVSVALACYVYPTHPALVWTALGFSWVCYRLGLRAKRLFDAQAENTDPSSPSHST